MPNWDDFEAVEPDWDQFTAVEEPSKQDAPDWSQFERIPSIPGSIPATPPPPIPMPEPMGRSLNEALAEFPKEELRAVTKAGLESEKRLAAAKGNLAGVLATGIEKAETPIVPPEVMRLGIAGGVPLPPRAEGVAQSVAEIGSSFTSPINLGLAAVTGGASAAAVPGSVLRQAIPRGVALGFGGEMLRHTPENLERYRAVIEDPNATEQEKTKAAADLLLQTGLGVGITGSGLAKLPKGAPRGEAVPEGTPDSPIAEPIERIAPEVLKPETKGVTDALPNESAAKIHGPLQEQPIESQRQVPTEEGGGGIRPPRPEAQAAEVLLKEPAAPDTTPKPEPAPELIGMGGAVPGEFAPTSKTASGIKNSTVDAERAARGLPPAIEPTRRAFGEVWDRAMAAIDRDPLIQDRLVKELSEKARALTDAEDALLLHRQIELQNEYGKATRDLAQAFDDGRTDDVRIEQQRVDALSDQLLELYEVGKAAGTETGRGLAARKMMANEDFTLAKMEVEKRAARGGKPLTESERAELVRLQNKITETQKAYDDYVASNAEKLAELESLRAFSEMQAKAAAEAPSPYVLQVAEKIVSHLEQRATDARTRLREKLARMGTSPDPTIILDLAELGAAHIARAGLDFAKWSTEMVREFGDKVSPMLEEAWKKSRDLVDSTADRFTERKEAAPRVKRVVTKDAETRQAALVDGIKENIAQGGTLADGRRFVQQLAEGFVASGIKERNPLIDAVHGVLKGIAPEITRRETMDLISGYGDFKQLNPDQIKAQLRDLKGQMQQVSKLEDIQAKKPLQKTGVERRSPSDEERRLIQQVNEAKKRYGVVVTDPARQLKSALDAVKTRLRNQISDLNYQIATRQKTVRQKSAPPSDAEVAKLTAERDALRLQFTEIFGKPELTPEQRLKIAERATDRAIERLEADLDAGRLKSQPKTSKTPESAGLLEKRAWLQALREHRKELLDLAEPKKTPEEIALQSLKTRLTSSIAEYQRRLKEGDFAPRKRRELDISKDPDAMRLKAQNEKWKEEYQRGLLMDRMKRRSTGQKVYAGVKEALNLPRTVLASWDLSAVLRQGGFITFGHPARALNAMRDMFKALASEDAARTANTALANRPNAPLYKRSKLYIAPLDALRLTAQEEAIMSRLADRIPGVKHSNRAYITFLNRIRADSFDAMVRSVERKGSPIKPEELDAIANYINVATGRGSLGKAAAAAETLATVFFSPRLVASRFQLVAGQPLYRGTARTRKLIAQEYGRTLLGLSVIYGLAQMSGAELEIDPRSSDFGKLKFGETRIDPLMGLAQITVLLSRLTTGEKVTLSGRLQNIRGDVPFGGQDASDVLKQFARTKLSPVVGAGVDIAAGANVIGEEVTPVSVATNMLIPLSLKDIYNVMVEQGIPAGTAITILSLFGMGVQHYE